LEDDWRHRKFIELDGKAVIDIPMMDWSQYPVKMAGTQAYIVNASYTPSKNSIYINLGYIQKPFIDMDERGIEYNLAHLGFTISHELSHAFDDWGSKYGWDGNLNDLWTDADKKKYKQIQQDVIQQYEEFAARDGITFDASIGVGEDLADISGMAICDEYLSDFQEKNGDLIPIRYFSYEAFYTYFAFQQRQVVTKKALAAQLKTNPHPLDKYRCNVPLSRSQIFRALYNVKKGDGMWWHNTDTVW
jgi:predicted metalloendopeptidase